MKEVGYPVDYKSDTEYIFFSTGPIGKIELRIIFQRDESETEVSLYNLAFGAWDSVLGDIDDTVQLRNGDMDKILATVAQTALNFMENNPEVYIFAQGSTPARTRKYQMGISKFFKEATSTWTIMGLATDEISGEGAFGGRWEKFQSGTKYAAFLLFAK